MLTFKYVSTSHNMYLIKVKLFIMNKGGPIQKNKKITYRGSHTFKFVSYCNCIFATHHTFTLTTFTKILLATDSDP